MTHSAKDSERLRLDTLYQYEILDTPCDASFDRITRLAKTIFRTPIARISFVDEHRQWFKSGANLGQSETPRFDSFCSHTIKSAAPLVVPDARADPRFMGFARVTGTPYIRSYIGAPLCAPNGQRIGALYVIDTEVRNPAVEEISMLQDLAQLVMDELELRLVATTDSLTGALSRRGFLEAATRDVARAQRHHEKLSCAIVDIDYFKQVNDGHGHAAGDRALQHLVSEIKGALRQEDYVGRIGGDELAIMLPKTAGAGALEIGDRLRSQIMNSPVMLGGIELNLTVSIGVAELMPGDAGIETILARADAAHYVAKSRGRNRSVRHEAGPLSAA